jgi:hypothetical protein
MFTLCIIILLKTIINTVKSKYVTSFFSLLLKNFYIINCYVRTLSVYRLISRGLAKKNVQHEDGTICGCVLPFPGPCSKISSLDFVYTLNIPSLYLVYETIYKV